MTPREAAVIIGCDPSHVRLLIRRGRIRAVRKLDKYGHAYYVLSPAEARRVRDDYEPGGKGYPRGVPRDGERGTKKGKAQLLAEKLTDRLMGGGQKVSGKSNGKKRR